jgi:hypothetical protein
MQQIIDISSLVHNGSPVMIQYFRYVLDHACLFAYKGSWFTTKIVENLADVFSVLHNCEVLAVNNNYNFYKEVLLNFKYENKYYYVVITLEPTHSVGISFCYPKQLSTQQVNAIIEEFKKYLPEDNVIDGEHSVINFSTNTSRGARIVRRKIVVNPWEKIQDNYVESVKESMLELTKDFSFLKGGQLLLWHGDPGTGKTYAIRALSYSWRETCDFFYVIDPEMFFGDPSYMLDLILKDNDYDEPDDLNYVGKWKVMVLEDAGDLVTQDAAEKMGQGLSRLLNTVDGLIGQGLRFLILITTNQSMSNLHPAIARPGRCAVEIHFQPFTCAQANIWLKDQKVKTKLTDENKKYTLADLYGLKIGFKGAKGVLKEERKVGFL